MARRPFGNMQSLTTVKEKTFPYSMNDKLDPADLGSGMCVLAKNCFLEERRIRERTGYSLAGNDTGQTYPILKIATFEPTGGTKQLLKIHNVDVVGSPSVDKAYVWYWTGSGNWTQYTGDYFTADLIPSVEVSNNLAYISNGTDVVKKWNGSTLSDVSSFPKAPYIKWFHTYMFALKKSRLYISNLGDPEIWGVSDFLDINPDDNDYGTGLGVLNNTLYIFKNQRIWGLTGFSLSTFSLDSVSEVITGIGCIAPQSIVNTGNDIFYLSQAGTTPHFRSLTRTSFAKTIDGGIISKDIETTMLGLNVGMLSKTTSFYDGRRIWWFVPDGASIYNNIAVVYDTVTEGWTKMTGIHASSIAMSTVTGNNVFYFGEASSHSRVYKMDSSTSDNGNAIDFQFISRVYTPDIDRKQKWKYLWIEASTLSANISVTVSTSVERNAFDSQGSISLSAQGSTFPMIFPFAFGSTGITRKRFDLSYGPAYGIQVKMEKNDTLAPAIVRDWKFNTYQKGIRDKK